MKLQFVFFIFSLLSLFSPFFIYSQTPTFEWAKQLDINSSVTWQKMAISNTGDIYITGGFSGIVDFDPGSGTYNMISNSNEDIFITKLNTSGNFVWAKQIGSSTKSCGTSAIAVDSLGNNYITGYFSGTVDFDPSANNFYLTNAGTGIFILKLDSAGNFLWAKQFGNNDIVTPSSINVDNLNYIHIAGSFFGTVDFDPSANIFNLSSMGGEDFFVSKIDASSGNLIWAKSLGGSWSDRATSIAIDEDDNIYVVGNFEDTVDFDPGSGSVKIYAGYFDNLFILKLDSAGNYVWVKNFNAHSESIGKSIVVDKNGNPYITGYFDGSTDFDPGPNVFTKVSSTRNTFILKLTSSGNFAWANHIKSIRPGIGYSLVLDGLGNLYITGDFVDTTDFDPGPGISYLVSKNIMAEDVFIAKYDTSGNLKWTYHIGGNQSERSYAIAVDSFNNVYSSGYFTYQCDFRSGSGTYILTSSGYTSTFIHKLSQCHPLDTSISVNGNTLSSNATDVSYQWIDCSNPLNILANDTNQSFSANVNGSYAVNVSQNSCSDTSACYSILNVGLQQIGNANPLVLYPNPTKGVFYLSSTDALMNAEIGIYDIAGKKINGKMHIQGNTSSFDLSGHPNGIYFIELKSVKEIHRLKIVKY